ncbi:probable JmjC domain-containing histone demethylation protein 2C [Rhincodon typus]|uniref:probable JmjC domain-containing histone demethylation protein 2C n=1 Tax=Rhincodon typus TaxID=259920 RepID=UPI002030DD20|nr:probable JmjC domain-containing histone demethylation protein 2C [Rhincodon typus]
MAPGPRTELVGKRFVCVGDSGRELDVSRIHEWHWRAGVIRAVSYREPSNRELSVYVEFDDLEWEKREWVKVYEDFKIFLVEHQLVWAKRKNPNQTQGSKSKQIQWPALTFKSVVGKAVLHLLIAIEFFVDKQLNFIPGDSAFQLYQISILFKERRKKDCLGDGKQDGSKEGRVKQNDHTSISFVGWM